MAISCTKYPIANVAQIGAAIVSAVEDSGMYDSAAFDSSTSTVTVSKNETTYLEIVIGSTTTFRIYADHIDGAAETFSVSASVISVAAIGKKVMITAYAGIQLSVILGQSKNGLNVVTYSCIYGSNQYYTPCAIPTDAAFVEHIALTTRGMPYTNSAPIFETASLFAASLSEGYTCASGVYRIVRKPR